MSADWNGKSSRLLMLEACCSFERRAFHDSNSSLPWANVHSLPVLHRRRFFHLNIITIIEIIMIIITIWPVSNLQLISKLTESAVAKQLQLYINMNNLFPMLRSSCRKFHSTKTLLLKVNNDIFFKHEQPACHLVFSVGFKRGFYIIDHGILLEKLRSAFGVRHTALSWFASYLSGTTQQVSIDGTLSTKFDLECSVPQGSCLGPLLFVVYANKIFEIVEKHNLEIHIYADDIRLYLSFSPNDNANQEAALARVERCIEDIRNWMLNDKLKLNDDKTEFMIIGTSQQLAKVSIYSLRVGTATNYHSWVVCKELGLMVWL